jgi:hypothetical protein
MPNIIRNTNPTAEKPLRKIQGLIRNVLYENDASMRLPEKHSEIKN